MSYSLDTLEYSSLLELVGRNAQTPMGFAKLVELRPYIGRHELDRALFAISETIHLNEEKQVSWSFSGLQDPSDAVAILKIKNATLEPTLLLELARVCNQALFARSSLQPEKEFAPTLWSVVEHLPPTLFAAIERITKKLLPGGEIDDSASPELARIRREINAQRSRLTKTLEGVMRSSGNAIQDEIVTVRNDRFVIPVKADFRGKVGGVAHGFSGSGATVFVEPLEVIEANNELQGLKEKEEREIARILADLTDELRDQLPAVELAVDAVAELDFVKTKVEFARRFHAVVPEISEDETLELIDARHPLLEENLRLLSVVPGGNATMRERAPTLSNNTPDEANEPRSIVPSSFALTKERSVMIISGANAGGKTVVLKTAGLLSLMAVSGLPVPARRARIPFYRSVLADIGDHQSLSANLSTFSSHMSNIAGMMRECREPSLVLLDEAGTGTDPDEGSALGVAIVDYFRRQCGSQVIASTHYRGLKMYAANDPSVINASVEFDERTLQPTYRLLLGLAGASSGIEIASRFGIEPRVIDNARQNLDIAAQEAEAYLQRLQSETRQAEDLRKALEEEREAVAMKYANLEIEAGKKERERQKEFERELAQAIDDFDRQSKTFVKTIEDKALKNRLDKERESRKAELKRNITTKMSDATARRRGAAAREQAEPRPVGSVPDGPIAVGSKVVTSFGNVGTVEKMDKDVAEVLVGGLRLRERIANLRPAAPTEQPKQSRAEKLQKQASVSQLRPENAEATAELNLIGKTTADADYELDRFIDEAYMAQLPRVRIIHGFGTGALKNFVHHFLKNNDLIERFEFAPPEQGGNGATIAMLKQ
jgi:DNA mismatch repair protein MutS2